MPADDEQRPARGRLWAVAIALAGLLLVATALARPGGPIAADRTEHYDAVVALPQIPVGGTASQDIVAAAGDLSSVSMRIGTFAGDGRCSITVALRDVSVPEPPVARQDHACDDLPDSEITEVLRFAPLAGSEGRAYRLEVTAAPGSTDRVSAWGGRSDDATPGLLDGAPLDASLEVYTGYGDAPRAWDLLGTAFDRIDDYGPWWETGGVLVVLALVLLGALVALALVRPRWVALALVVLAVARGLLFSSLLPTFEGPDEPAHVAYSQYLAEQHAIPEREHLPDPDRPRLSEEVTTAASLLHQPSPPPGDRNDFGAAAAAARDRLADDLDRRASGSGPAAGYPPHYYAVPAVLERVPGTIDERVGYLRLWSIAFGAATVLLAFALGRRLFPSHPQAAVLLAVAVAMHPQLGQQTSVVNNDAAVIAAGGWCLVLAFDLARRQRDNRWLVPLAGLAGGLALVTKGFAAAMVPLLALAWLLGRLRGQRPGPWWRDAAEAAGGFALGWGTWFVTSVALGLASIGLDRSDPDPAARGIRAFLDGLTAESWKEVRRNWVREFWGDFSWLDTPLPPWTQPVILVACLAGVALVLAWAVRVLPWALAWARHRLRRDDASPAPAAPGGGDTQAATILAVAAVAGTLAVLYILMYANFQNVGRFDLIQGRYALLVTPAVLALPALTLRSLAPRLSPVPVMAAVASSMVVLQVVGFALVTERFYL